MKKAKLERKLINRIDILIIFVVLAASLIFYFIVLRNGSSGELECRILSGNIVVMTVSLDKDSVFSAPGNPEIVFEIKNRSIAFISSDCPDKICVHTGFIKYSGQSALCLPNNIALRIVRAGKPAPEDVDAAAY